MFVIVHLHNCRAVYGKTIEEAIDNWEDEFGDEFDPDKVIVFEGNEVNVKKEVSYTVTLI